MIADHVFWSILFFILGIVINIVTFYKSDKILSQFFSPQIVSPNSAKDIYLLLNKLSNNAGIDLPLLYVSSSAQPNICSLISKNGNKIIFSHSLLKVLDAREIHAMLAYQVSMISNGVAKHHAYLACVASMPLFIVHLGVLFPSFGGHRSNIIPKLWRPISAPLVWFGKIFAFIGVSRSTLFEIDKKAITLGANLSSYANGLNKLNLARNKIKDHKLALLGGLSPIYNVALYSSSKFPVDNPIKTRIQRLINHFGTQTAPSRQHGRRSAKKTPNTSTKRVKRPGIASGPSRSRPSR